MPVTGFFEFHQLGKQTFPHYIHLKSRALFLLAGIYEGDTFSILTTEANPLMAFVHNSKKRMPVILPQEMEEAWTVSRLITSRTEDPDQEAVRHRVEYPELGTAGSFW